MADALPPIVAWSPDYRVSFFGIERLHPFDIAKADTVARHLVGEGLVRDDAFLTGAPADDDELATVHDRAYLEALHDLPNLAAALELWVPNVFPRAVVERRVRRPFRTSVAGTALAARAALAHGLGVNLGGGFHHARPAMGHGFCVYNDVAYAVAALRREGFAGDVLIVDTDAHQGDGNHAFFAADPSVFTFSMHQGDLFPHPKVPGDRDLELPAGTGDAAFSAALDGALQELLPAVKPALVVHVAGADVLHDDPLTGLALTVEGLAARDRAVARAAWDHGAAVLHVLAGGYGPSAARAQALSVAAVLRDHSSAGRGSGPT